MGTKNTPGRFDCYANAEPDEPMFILLGRDPMAGALVLEWAELRKARGEDPEKLAEAIACAEAMNAWAHNLGKQPIAHWSAHLEWEAQLLFKALGVPHDGDPKLEPLAGEQRASIRRSLERAYEKGRGDAQTG